MLPICLWNVGSWVTICDLAYLLWKLGWVSCLSVPQFPSSISGTNVHLWVLLCQHVLPLIFRKGSSLSGCIDPQRGHYTGGSRDWNRFENMKAFSAKGSKVKHNRLVSMCHLWLRASWTPLTTAMFHGPASIWHPQRLFFATSKVTLKAAGE